MIGLGGVWRVASVVPMTLAERRVKLSAERQHKYYKSGHPAESCYYNNVEIQSQN